MSNSATRYDDRVLRPAAGPRTPVRALFAALSLTTSAGLVLAAMANPAHAHASTPTVTASCDVRGTAIKWTATANGVDTGTLTGELQQRISGTWTTVARDTDTAAPHAVGGRARTSLLGPHRITAQFTSTTTSITSTAVEHCF